MVDAGEVYDRIHLDVTVGGGFADAQARINQLITQLEKLGNMVTPIRVDTTQVNAAIRQLESLSRGVVPPAAPLVSGRRMGPGRRAGDVLGDVIPPGKIRYWELQQERREREAEERLFREWEKHPTPYTRAQKEAHLAAMRPVARAEMEAAGIPYKTGIRDIAGATPAATENINKLNEAMAKTVDTATNLGQKTLPTLPPAISPVAANLNSAVAAADAARVKLDSLRLTGVDTAPAMTEAATAQKQLKDAIAGATTELPKNAAELKKANAALKNLNGTMEQGKEKTSAYTLNWKNMTAVMGKVAFWAVATGAIYGTIRAFKSMVDVIFKVDHAMADVRKVYQGAPSDIKPLRDDLIELTVALGGNVEQVMEAAVGWARLGYKRREIVTLMRTTMLAMNIAELNATEATELLTAAMQQFEIGAGAAIIILDSWNELSNRTLATTRDLGDSVSLAGATFAQTGDSIHYLNAVTATLVQTMAKSGREVGTAMRTIGTYIYRPKTIKGVREIAGVEITKKPAPARMAEETDAEYAKRLRDNMKSQSEVLGELAGKWDSLTEKQQINLAQQIAGVRRYNYFMALMKNYDLVLKNLIISIDSSGSAERENAIYMDTLQKKAERLRDAFVKLYVAGGDAGLAGILKAIIDGLRKFIDVIAGVDLRMVAITAAAILASKAIFKLVSSMLAARAAGGTLRGTLSSMISPAAAVNIGIMALGAALTYLASRAERARGALDRAIQTLNEVTGEMERSEEAVRNAADNLDLLATARESLLAKVRAQGGKFTDEQFRLYKQIEEASKKSIAIISEEEGHSEDYIRMAYKEGRVRAFVSSLVQKNNIELEEQVRLVDALKKEMAEAQAQGEINIDKVAEWAVRFEAITGQTVDAGKTATDIGAEGLWNYVKSWEGVARVALGVVAPMTLLGTTADALAESGEAAFNRLSGAVGEFSGNIKGTLQERYNKQIQNLADSFGEIEESVDGAGKEVDRLQLLIDSLNRELAPFRERNELVAWELEEVRKRMADLEDLYGDAVTDLPEYLALRFEEKTKLEEIKISYEAIYSAYDKAQNKLIEMGPKVVKTIEDQDKLNETIRTFGAEMRSATGSTTDTEIAIGAWARNITFAESAIKKLAKEARRGRESLEMVLPSREDTKVFADDLKYALDDINEIVDNLNKTRALAGETKIHYFEMKDILQLINMDEAELTRFLIEHNLLTEGNVVLQQKQLDLIEALGAAQEIVRERAAEINEEYRQLSNTFQNILDEGLYGIIMGEQTAIDLAKELGQEYARIALQTITQPATERFAAGMGAAAYFLRHGKAPGAFGGIMDVELVQGGQVPVYDAAVAAGLAAVAAGQAAPGRQLAPLGMGPVAPAAGTAGGGFPTWLGPMAGGAVSGAMMGAGGGAAGGIFGAGMGAIGGLVSSLIPGWGQVLGAGITMLGFLGNLFRGRRYEEEDPYARQQAAGIGDRSVTIGSAGTVNNYVYITMYYESSLESVDAGRLFDTVEEEGMRRGYQVTGSTAPLTV